MKLSEAQLALAEKAMGLLLLRANRVSFLDLYRVGNVAAGFAQYDQFSPCYRLADRFIQRLRKAGHIQKSRWEGGWVWTLTEAGRALLSQSQEQSHER